MNDEKEKYVGPVEQQINSIMENAGDEIIDKTQKESGYREDEIAQKIHITNLSKCVIYLARQIDKLLLSTGKIND